MNQNPISQDDPRLTTYALNEMEPAERTEFEQALAQDAAARRTVEEIRATAATLTAALENEPFEPVEVPVAKHDTYAKVIRFPYWKVSGLAAACFVAFFIYLQNHEIPLEQKHYIEMPLTAPVDPKAESKAKVADVSAAADLPVVPLEPEATTVMAEKLNRDESRAKAGVSVAKAAKPNAFVDQEAGSKDGGLAGKIDSPVVSSAPVPETPAAQSPAPAPTVAVPLDSKEETIVLNPFMVTGTAGSSHGASSTLGGIRARKQSGGLFAGVEREHNTEAYAYRKDNGFLRVKDEPLSTFSADVDTASYANVRRFLTQGQRPPIDAVRIEELVNYFPYSYAGPAAAAERMAALAKDRGSRNGGASSAAQAAAPFATNLEVAGAPWAPEHRLVRIGIKGREVSDATRPPANLVFLLDVSGSMDEPNKLPLVKQSLRLLVGKLRPDDRVAIAVYAGASGLALPSTPAAHQREILEAIDRLEAQGSTNGEAGIQLAYDIAKANFITGGVNRVILATDGDFNVGVSSESELVRLIGEKAGSGVFLTVLGFGMGNIKDHTLEQLADKGNGHYAYIDSLAEAKKTLVEQAGGTLVTIAKDVKLQVEFNPAAVQAYRLIGYENRLLAREDFNNDQVDAGEIGAGHTVTALYEVVPAGAAMPTAGSVDPLKYQVPETPNSKLQTPKSNEMLTVKIRYKDPAAGAEAKRAPGYLTSSESYKDSAPDVSNKLEFVLRDTGAHFDEASPDFKFAAAVAAYGMVLRDSPYKGSATLENVLEWGRAGVGSDAGGYRSEFLGLVEQTRQVMQ
jgi:Ca-activated chloride channel family protein